MTSYPCDDEATFRAYGCKAKGEKQPVENRSRLHVGCSVTAGFDVWLLSSRKLQVIRPQDANTCL